MEISVCACVLNHSVMSDYFVVPWTVIAHQASLSMGFSRQECWSGLAFPPAGHLSNPGIEPVSPMSPILAGGFFPTEPPEKSEISDATTLKDWKTQAVNLGFSYPVKISFRNKGDLKIFFRHTKAGRVYHHKTYRVRNVKETPLGKRKWY